MVIIKYLKEFLCLSTDKLFYILHYFILLIGNHYLSVNFAYS